MPTVPPCPQAAAVVSQAQPPPDPWITAIERVPPAPREAPPPAPDPMPPAPLPEVRWPYHGTRWNAIDALWWSCLSRAAYSQFDVFMRRAAEWAGPMVRMTYVPSAAPPVVGRALIELGDQWLCVIPGTTSDDEALGYILSHSLAQTGGDAVEGWTTNMTWYLRAATVYTAALAWPYPGGKPMTAIGHSAGGAEAGVFAMLYDGFHLDPMTHAVTLGSPRWGSPSIRDYVLTHKRPQVVEFTTRGDPITLLPPPWSVLDLLPNALRGSPRPEYVRVGGMLALIGADGLEFVPDDTSTDVRYRALQTILAGRSSGTAHRDRTYNHAALDWARSFAARQDRLDLIEPLAALVLDMDDANI